MMGGGGMMNGFGYGGGFGLFGGLISFIFNIVLIIGVVLLVIWAIKKFSPGSSNTPWAQNPQSQSPKEILKIRYARGEITREQFQQMLSDLG